MAKVNLTNIGTLTPPSSAVAALNDNMAELARAMDTMLSRDGQGPNQMEAELDMNSQKILNVADPEDNHDAVNLEALQSAIAGALYDGATVIIEGDATVRTDLANGAAGYGAELVAYDSVYNVKERLDNIEAGAGGDPTLRADLASVASSKGAELLGYKSAGTGAYARTAQDKFGEQTTVADFGAIGDGTTHPLSERYATLAEAQAVYAHAVALTDEIDWCAWQAAINARQSATNYNSLLVGDGDFVINRPLVVTNSLGIKAVTKECCRITMTGAGDLLTAGACLIEGLDFFHEGASGSSIVSSGDNLRILGCGFVPGASNTSPIALLKHANHNIDASVFVTSHADQWCVDVVADTGNFCINGTIGGQTTMYGVGNGVRFRVGTGGRPEGWSLQGCKIIVTGSASVEVQSCLMIDVAGCTLDQATEYGVRLSPTGNGIDGLSVHNCYIATPANLTTGKGVAATVGTGDIRHLSVNNNHIELCRDGIVTDSQMIGTRIISNTLDNIPGVSIDYSASVATTILGNFLRGANTALRLVDGATGDQTSVIGNNIDTNASVVYTPTDATGFEFHGNTGKKLSGWGSAVSGTISSGTSSYLLVPHGLAITPSVNKITAQVATASGGFIAPSANVVAVDATNVQLELFYTVVSPGTIRATISTSG